MQVEPWLLGQTLGFFYLLADDLILIRETSRVSYNCLSLSSPGVWTSPGPMFENEESRDPPGFPPAASSGCSVSPGAYIRTNRRILEKSVLRGRWERIDYKFS